MRLKDILDLLRMKQWYKNLLVFLPLIFVKQLFNVEYFILTLIGFFCLCLTSSTNYIINDIIDVKKDKLHPEKKRRVIAAGNVKKIPALLIASALFAGAIIISAELASAFLVSMVSLFALTQLYTLLLKNEAFIDVLMIAINFVIRAASGAFIINVVISPWLVICVFFLALFLAVGKRAADTRYLGKNAQKHKKVLKHYTPELTTSLMNITTSLLILSYTFYSFLSQYHSLFLTLPFSLYVIFRYYYLVNAGSEIARHPEKAIKDIRLVTGIVMWIALTIILLYI